MKTEFLACLGILTLNSHIEVKRKSVDKTGKVNISALKWNLRAWKKVAAIQCKRLAERKMEAESSVRQD